MRATSAGRAWPSTSESRNSYAGTRVPLERELRVAILFVDLGGLHQVASPERSSHRPAAAKNAIIGMAANSGVIALTIRIPANRFPPDLVGAAKLPYH